MLLAGSSWLYCLAVPFVERGSSRGIRNRRHSSDVAVRDAIFSRDGTHIAVREVIGTWHSSDEMDSWRYSQPMAFVGRGSAWRYFQPRWHSSDMAVLEVIGSRWHSSDEMDSSRYSQPVAFVGRGSSWRYCQEMAFVRRGISWLYWQAVGAIRRTKNRDVLGSQSFVGRGSSWCYCQAMAFVGRGSSWGYWQAMTFVEWNMGAQ